MARHILFVAALAATIPTAHAGITLVDNDDWMVESRGTLQYELHRYNDPALGADGSRSANDWRRAQLVLRGRAPGALRWTLGYDVNSERWLDVNLQRAFGQGDRHQVTVGQFKQFGGMEELTSSSAADFIAKASVTNTFVVQRRLGLGYAYAGDRWLAQASAFDRELTRDQATGRGQAVRVVALPIKAEGQTLQLGGFIQRHEPVSGSTRLRTRPNAELSSVRRIDTGTLLDADLQQVLGLEALWLSGPLKLQAEWMQATVQRDGAPDFSGHGSYVSALWNIGGQAWRWQGGTARQPSAAKGGWGLWQAGLRLDDMDLNDDAIVGGRMQVVTTGLNWAYGENTRVMLNHVQARSRRAGVRHDDRTLKVRLQVYW